MSSPLTPAETTSTGQNYIIIPLKKKKKKSYTGESSPKSEKKFKLLIHFLIIIVLPLWPHTSCRPSLRFISSEILACVCSPLQLLSHRSDRAARGGPHCPEKLHARTKHSEQGECPSSCLCIYRHI